MCTDVIHKKTKQTHHNKMFKTYKTMKVVSFDPGMTNLGFCVLDWRAADHSFALLDWGLKDLGSTRTEEAVESLVAWFNESFQCVDLMVLETQYNNPKMMALSHALQALGVCQGAKVVFVSSAAKFKWWKKQDGFKLPPPPKSARSTTKNNAIFITRSLIPADVDTGFFQTIPTKKQEHYADCLGNALAYLATTENVLYVTSH